MNQVYVEGSFKVSRYELGVQYLRSVSDSKLKEVGGSDLIDSTLYGVRGGVTLGSFNAALAYNEASRKKNTLYYGGAPALFDGVNDPIFTSVNQEINHRGTVESYKVELVYSPIENYSITLSQALFHKGDGFDQSESDLLLSGIFTKNIDGMIKASILNETDSVGAATTNDHVRAIIRFKF